MLMQALPPADPQPTVIVVTGTALPDPAAERAYAVETITDEELANAPSHQLEQILVHEPGLQLFRRSDAASAHPTSQGITLRALGGNASSRALLILDGVPQADPFGGWLTWPAYDPASLEQVRVVRGGGTVPYGPGALAGVITMSSRTEATLEGTAEVGSREAVLVRGYTGVEVGGALLSLNARGARSSGFIPVTEETRGAIDQRAPYEQASLRARAVATVAPAVELQAGGLLFSDSRERGLPFTDNRTRGADASLRLVGSGNWQWSALGYAQWRNFRSSFASVDDDRSEAARVALQDSVPSRGFGGSLELRPPVGAGAELRIGADARLTSGESREFYNYADGEPLRRRVAGGESATVGAFAEASLTRGAATLSGGFRLDRWRISEGHLVERLIATGAATRDDAYDDRSGWRPTARGGIVYDLGGGFEARSAAYLGWRLPTLNELFRPFRAGADATAANPSLDPERLGGAEAGVRFVRGGVSGSLTGFVNRLSDAIANVTLGHGPGVFPGVGFVAGDYRQRRNIDAVNVRGIEASAEAARGPWSARMAGSYVDARVDSSGMAAALDGLRPAQTPELVVSGEVGWEQGARALSVQLRRSSGQFEDDLNRQRLPAATTVGAFAAWPLSERLQIVGRAENLFDETVAAAIDSDGLIERATPRTLWIGLRLRTRR